MAAGLSAHGWSLRAGQRHPGVSDCRTALLPGGCCLCSLPACLLRGSHGLASRLHTLNGCAMAQRSAMCAGPTPTAAVTHQRLFVAVLAPSALRSLLMHGSVCDARAPAQDALKGLGLQPLSTFLAIYVPVRVSTVDRIGLQGRLCDQAPPCCLGLPRPRQQVPWLICVLLAAVTDKSRWPGQQWGSRRARMQSSVLQLREPVFVSTATEWHAAQGWVLYAAVPLLNKLHKTFWLATCCIPMPLIDCGLKRMPTLNVALRRRQACGLERCVCGAVGRLSGCPQHCSRVAASW